MNEKNDEILTAITGYFKHHNTHVCVAESVTSGCVQWAFSRMEDASRFFNGGITTYTIFEKVKLLGIDHDEAERTNCVSLAITEEMARNVSRLFNAAWAIATTGYATPVPESGNKTFAFLAIVHNEEIVLSRKIEFEGEQDAAAIQQYYCRQTLIAFLEVLQQTGKPHQ